MLVACRLAGLSALEAHYASLLALTQLDPLSPVAKSDSATSGKFFRRYGRPTAKDRYRRQKLRCGEISSSSISGKGP
jgi:hypothetical protein